MRKWHLWLALVIGLPVAVVSATGLAITYWGASDALFDAPFYGVGRSHAVAPIDFDRLGDAALAVPGALRLKGISLLRDGRTAIATVASGDGTDREVSLDPATSAVMGVRNPQGSAIFLLYSLHTRLLLDQIGQDAAGQAIVVMLAASVLGLLVSGVLLWWPQRWRWELILPVVRRPHAWRDLHNKSGLYALLPLAIAAITAILLSLPGTRSIGASGDHPVPGLGEAAFTAERLPLNDIARAATAAARLPVTDISRLDQSGPILVYCEDARGERRWVVVDRRQLTVEAVRDSYPLPQESDPSFLIGLHQGHRWGAVGQALFALAGVVPLGLYVTGLVLWLRRPGRMS